MGVSTVNAAAHVRAADEKQSLWLRNRRWDLIFITLSVIVVPLPYLAYLLGRD